MQATQNRNVTTKDPPLGASLGPSLAFALKPKIRVLDRFKAKQAGAELCQAQKSLKLACY